jgi:fibronectin type 3 domain-containing protein
MNTKRIAITIIAGLLLASNSLCAQSGRDTLTIHLAARAMDGRVVLRWSPTDYQSWIYGNQQGYRVMRTTLEEARNKLAGEILSSKRVVIADQLRPLPELDWKVLADTNHLAIIAAGSLYSPVFDTPASAETTASDYNEKETQTNRFSFGLFAADQFLDIARGMALGFVDTTVIAGEVYRYTVSFAGSGSRSIHIPGEISIAANRRIRLLPPSELTAQWRTHGVRLKWNRSRVDTLYSAYYVERSEDSGATFSRINQAPLVYMTPEGTYDPFMYYVDSLANNETEYFYRVRGTTPFGELGPSSDMVSGKGKRASLTTPPGILFMEELPEQSGLLIGWIVDSTAIGRVKGFHIYESLEKGASKIQINADLIPPGTRQFIIDRPGHGNYYQIGLTDDTGYELMSTAKLAMLRDDLPPTAPTGLRGVMDAAGKTAMAWSSNPEEDLQGYRIYTGNHETGYFAELTYLPVSDTIYRHVYSMNTLHEAEFFKVRAIDLKGNYSDFSKPAKIIRPDLHPPTPPAFTNVRSERAFVWLHWANSSSRDVVQHTLERRALKEAQWQQVAVFSVAKSAYAEYADSAAMPGRQYQYRVIATDQNGLNSTSAIIQGGRIESGGHGAIRNFSGVFDNEEDKVLLTWQYPRIAEVDRFLLYRSLESEPISLYKTLDINTMGLSIQGDTARFEGAVFKSGKRFQYQLLAILKDGDYSELSNLLFVEH